MYKIIFFIGISFFMSNKVFAQAVPVATPISITASSCGRALSVAEQTQLLAWSLTRPFGRTPICIIYNPSAATTCLFQTIKTYLAGQGSDIICQIQNDSEIHGVGSLGWVNTGGQLIIAEL